ncbi:hypothetical protein WR25_25851 [Diploscapter pachys]|uniref:Uncharacterized protein n=1 Tax=Diploscapter pachys TaxID=2018661 RepID=A0A2A2JZH2_9BILA|nr:hypothetical protein WR25_25851 [Diploscapter pachys]
MTRQMGAKTRFMPGAIDRVSHWRLARRFVAQQHAHRQIARLAARQVERARHRRAEQRVAQRHQHQVQRLFLDRPLGRLHAIGKFVDQIVDGGQDRIERIAIARQDHPARQRTRAAAVEGIEDEVDDTPRIGLPAAVAQHGIANHPRDLRRHPRDQRLLQPLRGPEVMQQVGMRAADPRADRLQRHRLRAAFDQQLLGGDQRGFPAFGGGQAAAQRGRDGG